MSDDSEITRLMETITDLQDELASEQSADRQRIAALEAQNTALILAKEEAETRLLFARNDTIASFSLLPQERRKTGSIVVAWSVIDDASRRIQELEAQLAASQYEDAITTEVDRRNGELVTRVNELEAQLAESQAEAFATHELLATTHERMAKLDAQLAAAPQWTRIDNSDSGTWPPDDSTIVEVCQWQDDGKWWIDLLTGMKVIHLSSFNSDPLDAYYWRPFTPPEPET